MLNIELSCFSVYFPFQICRCKCGGLGGGSDTLKIKIKKNSIPMSFAGAFPIRECNSGSEEVSVSLDRLPLLTGQGSGNQWCGECFQFPEPTETVGVHLCDLKSRRRAWRPDAFLAPVSKVLLLFLPPSPISAPSPAARLHKCFLVAPFVTATALPFVLKHV